MYDKVNNLQEEINRLTNERNAEAAAIIKKFVDKHGKDGKVNIHEVFLDEDGEEDCANAITVTCENRRDPDRMDLEILREISFDKDGHGPYVNGEPLCSWCNNCIVTPVVNMLNIIEEKLETGEGLFENGEFQAL